MLYTVRMLHELEEFACYVCMNLRASADILGKSQQHMVHMLCNTFSILKIYPNLLSTVLPLYTATGSHYDYGIFILTLA